MRFEDNEADTYLRALVRFQEADGRPMREINRVAVRVSSKPFIVLREGRGDLFHLGDGLYEYVAHATETTADILEFKAEGTKELEVLAELVRHVTPTWTDLKEYNKPVEDAEYAAECRGINGFPKRKYTLDGLN